MSKIYVTVKLTMIGPDDRHADDDEVRDAIESECADLGEFTINATDSEDGYEEWTVDEATVISIDPA